MSTTHVEALLISAVLRSQDYITPTHQGVNNTMFHNYSVEWRWIEKYIARYRKPPSKTAFKFKFPEFPLKAVDDVAHFTEEVKREHTRVVFTNLVEESLDYIDADDIEEAVRSLHAGIVNITSGMSGESGDFNLLTDYDLVYQDVKRRVDAVNTVGAAGIPTGFPTLDSATGGMQEGDYWIMAARFGQGKSWSLNRIMVNAIMAGFPVAYFALEQNKNQIAFRLLNLLSSSFGRTVFPAQALRNGKGFNLVEFREFLETLGQQDKLGGCHIFDSSRGKVTGLTIAAQIERVKPKLVIVDYLTLMDSKDKDWQSVAKMSNDMAQLAKRYELPILCAAQINRMGEGKEPPKASHLSGSDAIGQDADAVVTLSQQSPHVIKYRLAKLRDGADQVMWYAEFQPELGRYGEISGDDAMEIVEFDSDEA